MIGFSNLGRNVRWLIAKVPIYGQLTNATKNSLREATTDIVTATLFSLLPLWFYPIISKITYGVDFWKTVVSFVGGGELFLYSAALVGPLIYSITKKYGEFQEDETDGSQGATGAFPKRYTIQFPYGMLFVLISVLVLGFSAYFFGISREASLDGNIRKPDSDNLLLTSGIMYVFTLSCFYCVSVYRLQLDNTAQRFGSDTRDLMKEWGGGND